MTTLDGQELHDTWDSNANSGTASVPTLLLKCHLHNKLSNKYNTINFDLLEPTVKQPEGLSVP